MRIIKWIEIIKNFTLYEANKILIDDAVDNYLLKNHTIILYYLFGSGHECIAKSEMDEWNELITIAKIKYPNLQVINVQPWKKRVASVKVDREIVKTISQVQPSRHKYYVLDSMYQKFPLAFFANGTSLHATKELYDYAHNIKLYRNYINDHIGVLISLIHDKFDKFYDLDEENRFYDDYHDPYS